MPENPSDLNREVSFNLSAFILKLLAKDPDDRYQSSYGMQFDFREISKQLQDNDKIIPLVLGKKDFPLRFMIPERLFLRNDLHLKLTSQAQRILEGTKIITLLEGGLGVGKSPLIEYFLQEVDTELYLVGSGAISRLPTRR